MSRHGWESGGSLPGATQLAPQALALRLNRRLIVGTLVLIIAGASAYTVAGVGMNMSAFEMTFMDHAIPMDSMAGSAQEAAGVEATGNAGRWSPATFVFMFMMWWVMMIAMMLPSAAPTVLLYTALLASLKAGSPQTLAAIVFVAGYLLAWGGFSLAATGIQWWLEGAQIMDPARMKLAAGLAAPWLLIAAGAYQFSPLKNKCLAHCRTPAEFIACHHRPGLLGAVRLGVLHGAFCLGCCFALMTLLCVGGIMNLAWIFGLAALVALEKFAPKGRLIGRFVGSGLLGIGVLGLIAT